MRQEEGLQVLRNILYSAQKSRSIMMERAGVERMSREEREIQERLWALTSPWLFDERKCVIPALSRIIDRVEAGGSLQPLDVYNFCTIAHKLEPMLRFPADITMRGREHLGVPEPDPAWLRGWTGDNDEGYDNNIR